MTIGVSCAGLLGLSVLLYSCLAPRDRSQFSAPIARLSGEGRGVTYVANGGLYVVAQPSGGFLALDEWDPTPGGRPQRCIVRWRPDLDGGVFQQDPACGSGSFGRDGMPAMGGPALYHHPLRVAGKSVVVDIRQCEVAPAGGLRRCAELRT